jgi:hypothetical protein
MSKLTGINRSIRHLIVKGIDIVHGNIGSAVYHVRMFAGWGVLLAGLGRRNVRVQDIYQLENDRLFPENRTFLADTLVLIDVLAAEVHAR